MIVAIAVALIVRMGACRGGSQRADVHVIVIKRGWALGNPRLSGSGDLLFEGGPEDPFNPVWLRREAQERFVRLSDREGAWYCWLPPDYDIVLNMPWEMTILRKTDLAQVGEAVPTARRSDNLVLRDVAASSDGTSLAFIAHVAGKNLPTNIALMSVEDKEVTLVTDYSTLTRCVDPFGGLSWRPESSEVVFVEQRAEVKAAEHGGTPLVTTEEKDSSIVSLDVRTGETTELYVNRATMLRFPTWSPEGERLAFIASVNDGGMGKLMLLLGGGDGPATVLDEVQVSGISWTADGKGIVFADTRGRISVVTVSD